MQKHCVLQYFFKSKKAAQKHQTIGNDWIDAMSMTKTIHAINER